VGYIQPAQNHFRQTVRLWDVFHETFFMKPSGAMDVAEVAAFWPDGQIAERSL
jgi:hypothetical protein